MKVVVIGMLDRQVSLAGEFPNLNLRYSNKSSKHSVGSTQMINHADKLVMMTKFVSHGTYDRLDRNKLIYCNGGVAALRDILTDLNAKATPKLTTPLEDEEDMPVGQPLFDFTPILHADDGDEFHYDRPDSMPPDVFNLRMQQTRSYYKREHGVLSEQIIHGGKNKATIKITRSASSYRDEKRREQLAKINEPKPEVARLVSPIQYTPPLPDDVLPPVPLERPVYDTAVATEPASGYAPQLWREVLINSLHSDPRAGIDIHISAAEKAVAAYTTRFGASA